MTTPDEHRVLPHEPPLPLRFGIGDAVCVTLLFGLHITALHTLFGWVQNGHKPELDQHVCIWLLAFASAFGPAYLTFRYVTERKVERFGHRILVLLLADLMANGPFVLFILLVTLANRPAMHGL